MYTRCARGAVVDNQSCHQSQQLCPLPAAADTGYVAAYLSAPLPPECANLTIRACAACQALNGAADKAGCIACAQRAASALAVMDTFLNGIKTLTRAETCAACYGTTAVNTKA